MYVKTKKSIQIAIAIVCVATVVAVVMGVLSNAWHNVPLIWGCVLSGIVALCFGVRYVYLKIRAKSEPYYTEMSGVIMRIDPTESSWHDEPEYFLG